MPSRDDSVGSIITNWLKANGFDGLAGDECGCSIEDMGCCEQAFIDCVPAHKVDCSRCKDGDECSMRNSDSDILFVSECEHTIRVEKIRRERLANPCTCSEINSRNCPVHQNEGE